MKNLSLKKLKEDIARIKGSSEDLPRMSAEMAAKLAGKPLVCKFYADTAQGQKNKLFHFSVNSRKQAYDLLIKALRSEMKVKAAYLNCPALRISDKLPVSKLSADMALSTE